MADDTSSLSFLRRHPFWWFLIGPAGAAGSVWGKRLGETVHFWSYRFHPRPSAYRGRSRWAINWRTFVCRPSAASSATRVAQVARHQRTVLYARDARLRTCAMGWSRHPSCHRACRVGQFDQAGRVGASDSPRAAPGRPAATKPFRRSVRLSAPFAGCHRPARPRCMALARRRCPTADSHDARAELVRRNWSGAKRPVLLM